MEVSNGKHKSEHASHGLEHDLPPQNIQLIQLPCFFGIHKSGETATAGLAKALNISEESAAYLVAHMTQSCKVHSHVRATEESV